MEIRDIVQDGVPFLEIEVPVRVRLSRSLIDGDPLLLRTAIEMECKGIGVDLKQAISGLFWEPVKP